MEFDDCAAVTGALDEGSKSTTEHIGAEVLATSFHNTDENTANKKIKEFENAEITSAV